MYYSYKPLQYDLYLFLKKYKLYFSFYGLRKRVAVSKPAVVFIVDKRVRHAGLADRLKAMVTAYYVAKQNGVDFKIVHTHPFRLDDYLAPNRHDWRLDDDQVSYSLRNARILNTYGMRVPRVRAQPPRQYHVYTSVDILARTCPEPECRRIWGELYQELFRPSERLQNALDAVALQENSYIAVHLRFVNALGRFEVGVNNCLDEAGRADLLGRCHRALEELRSRYPTHKIVVFSDSKVFLDSVRTMENIVVLDGKLGHVTHDGHDDEVTTKVFLDFYLLAKAKKVYSIIAPEMYLTAFSAYAAWSGLKEFERIMIP